MCAIAGVFRFKSGRPVTRDEILSMCSVMAHRGPDDEGVFLDGAVGLGHRRLSVIDPSPRGHQPMLDASEDLVISFNGEVYNHVELRRSLAEDGVRFRSDTDTEVILELYRRHGADCVHHLIGMFAFAIWDRRDRSILIVRDRLGIKPLYIAENADGIAVASEAKALLEILGRPCQVDRPMLDLYMSLGYTPASATLISGIARLEPGHYLQIRNGSTHLVRYWDIPYRREQNRGARHYQERVEELLREAVRLRLRSDVPLGVLLSGGIDSSAIVALMRSLGVCDLKTFSVAWDAGDEYDESRFARLVAERFDTDHQQHFITSDEYLGFLPRYVHYMDEPVADPAAPTLHQIARVARQSVTVALSGEGSDEAFTGYPIYFYMKAIEQYRRLPGSLRQRGLAPLLRLLGDKARRYVALSELPIERRYLGVSFYDLAFKRSLYSRELAEACSPEGVYEALAPYYAETTEQPVEARMQHLDFKTWLPNDLLAKADRMSMACSLELRVPFLDHRLVELAANIPSRHRIVRGQTKHTLKKAMQSILPKEIVHRPKMGFPTPLPALLRGPMRDHARDLLDADRLEKRGYFDRRRIRTMLDQHETGAYDHHRAIWQLMVLEEWHRCFAD